MLLPPGQFEPLTQKELWLCLSLREGLGKGDYGLRGGDTSFRNHFENPPTEEHFYQMGWNYLNWYMNKLSARYPTWSKILPYEIPTETSTKQLLLLRTYKDWVSSGRGIASLSVSLTRLFGSGPKLAAINSALIAPQFHAPLAETWMFAQLDNDTVNREWLRITQMQSHY